MRFTMGRYIAELDAEGRDRLIATPQFGYGGALADHDSYECGVRPCLVDAATGEAGAWCRFETNGIGPDKRTPPSFFDEACLRFGKARVVRAIKLRAARLNGCDPSTIRALLDNPASVGVGQ